MKKLSVLIALGLIVSGSAAFAGDAEDVIALAKSQWKAQIDQAPAAKIMESVSDDYTEFNPDYPTRIDGKALNMRFAEASGNDTGKLLVADMANAKVQIHGDVAILTYNYLGAAQASDGTISEVTAKSTRVYAKERGKWMLVHANFSPVTNVPDN